MGLEHCLKIYSKKAGLVWRDQLWTLCEGEGSERTRGVIQLGKKFF